MDSESTRLLKTLSGKTFNEALSGTYGSSESPSLMGRNLTPVSSAVVEEEEKRAIEQRDGFLWTCVERIKVSEGYIYKYRLRDEYDVVKISRSDVPKETKEAVVTGAENLLDSLHPAVETIISLLPFGSKDYFMWEYGERQVVDSSSERLADVLKELGYKFEYTQAGVFTQFPDNDVIENRWKGIIARHPDWNLKQLNIRSSEGVASDREFVDAYYECDAVLSTGREFVHDHQFHMLNTIKFMVEDPVGYLDQKRYHIDTLNLISDKVDTARNWLILELGKGASSKVDKTYLARLKKNLEYADVIPSIFADIYAADSRVVPELPMDQDITLMIVGGLLEKSVYSRDYLPKRFPDKDISMSWVWNEALDIWDSQQKPK